MYLLDDRLPNPVHVQGESGDEVPGGEPVVELEVLPQDGPVHLLPEVGGQVEQGAVEDELLSPGAGGTGAQDGEEDQGHLVEVGEGGVLHLGQVHHLPEHRRDG